VAQVRQTKKKERQRSAALVPPTTNAGGSEVLAELFQGEKLAKGTPTARHPVAREPASPTGTQVMKLSTVPIMPRAALVRAGLILAFTPKPLPSWLIAANAR
jgi:hypothetical protein